MLERISFNIFAYIRLVSDVKILKTYQDFDMQENRIRTQ